MAALLKKVSPGRPVIVVGYSLGGMVAQALWRRHPEHVGALVLGATSAAPIPPSRGRRAVSAMMSLAGQSSAAIDRATRTPRQRTREIAETFPRSLPVGWSHSLRRAYAGSPLAHWAADEFAGHHWPTLLDAGRAIAEFDARDWVGDIDVPTRVLVTKRDGLIPPDHQRALADAIENAQVENIDAGHLACVRTDFGDTLLASCRALERELA